MNPPLWLWVALGSAFGGVGRFALGRACAALPTTWPVSTMTANIVGSFLIGALSVWIEARADEPARSALRAFLLTGVLGGFTTYSAFALETALLTEASQWLRAAGYVLVTVAACLLAVGTGRAVLNAIIAET